VLTLTSFGMVQRSRPHDRDASRVIALWKDPTKGVREIPLEPGAHGVVLTLCADRGTRRSADARRPVDNGTSCFDAAVHQVRASSAGSGLALSRPTPPTAHTLPTEDLTVLTAWAEGVSEAAAHASERIDELLGEARAGVTWRAALGLPEPSPRLADAMRSLDRIVRAAEDPAGALLFDVLLIETSDDDPGEGALHGVVRRVLHAVLEERETRRATQAHTTR
jgi:hypothetical protein